MSITVIPKTVTTSCYAAEGTDGCSINLPAGLRSGSTVVVTLSEAVEVYTSDGDYYDTTNTFSSGITSSGIGGCRQPMTKKRCYEMMDYSNITGLSVGSTSVGVYRNDWYEDWDVDTNGEGGGGRTFFTVKSKAMAFTFTVNY